MEKVTITLLVLVALSNARRSEWGFVEKGKNTKTHPDTQLSAHIAKSLGKCAIDCSSRQYCQSISYNDDTQECILQSIPSDHHHLLIVEEPGFSIFDLIPPLEQNETKPVSLCKLLSPCENNGTCIDGPGIDYLCNCSNGYNGTNCHVCPSEVFRGQNCTTTGPTVLLIGGHDSTTSLNTMELYDVNDPANSRTLNKMLDVPIMSHVSVLLKNRTVVTAGGETTGSVVTNETVFFDLHLNQISTGPQLHEERTHAAGAIVNNTVYICGGLDGSKTQSRKSCEKMDFNSPLQWLYIKSMNEDRSHVTMVEHNGYVYAIGGRIDLSAIFHSSMERYDQNADSWQMMASMNETRLACDATVFNGMIYVCGGATSSGVMSSTCERYVPSANQWFPVAAMIKDRYLFMLATVDNKLFAFGGQWGDYNTVEWYDPTANNWTITQSLKAKRGSVSGVVLI